MPIKINGQTTGSVTLTAPTTGSDVTLTLPTTALATESFVSGSYLPIAGGKILQVVRATDTTARTTTSTSFVDASISVTITPQKNNSAILLVWSAFHSPFSSSVNDVRQAVQITDNSNNTISGAENTFVGALNLGGGSGTRSFENNTLMTAYATPATTSAITYKGRFRSTDAGTTARLRNDTTTGQMFAIEVAA